jgi:hypothetical protein
LPQVTQVKASLLLVKEDLNVQSRHGVSRIVDGNVTFNRIAPNSDSSRVFARLAIANSFITPHNVVGSVF